jgi:branched-chain amino acid transport system permease protein
LSALLANRNADWLKGRGNVVAALALLAATALLPFFYSEGSSFIDDAVIALAFVVSALGLNIVVGFAGLLDLGYVAFYAIGAYTMGWFGSSFFAGADGGEGVHAFVSGNVSALPGFHLNFVLILIIATLFCAVAGALIGVPTLRLRGDYIAVVTLAFGEIVRLIAVNGDQLKLEDTPVIGGALKSVFGADAFLTQGRQGITPVDKVDLPLANPFTSLNLRPWFWTALALVALTLFVNFRLRDSRLGRAWIALREDEVAAASMGVPLVRTKLLAYATGAVFGGMSGAFLGSYVNTVNADQFEFAYSILILAMVILGGLGSIWGVVVGAIALSFIDTNLIPDVLAPRGREVFGEGFDVAELGYGIFGFLLVIMMVLRPQGLLPERRRQAELTEGIASDESVYEARA